MIFVRTAITAALIATVLPSPPEGASTRHVAQPSAEPGLMLSAPAEPVALVASADRESVLVACAGGELVRLQGRRVAGSWRVGRALSDLIALDAERHDGARFAAADPVDGQVILLGDDLTVIDRTDLPSPTSIVQLGAQLAVASSADRSVTLLEPAAGRRRLGLPFAPGEMLWSRATQRLTVADAFGGSLAEVDTQTWQLVSVREIAGHNLRGLAFDTDGTLLVAHQVLDPLELR